MSTQLATPNMPEVVRQGQALVAASFSVPIAGHPEPVGEPGELVGSGGVRCPWIHGDPREAGWRCCGLPKPVEASWCSFHSDRAFDKGASGSKDARDRRHKIFGAIA